MSQRQRSQRYRCQVYGVILRPWLRRAGMTGGSHPLLSQRMRGIHSADMLTTDTEEGTP
jgi:hypothetical protein